MEWFTIGLRHHRFFDEALEVAGLQIRSRFVTPEYLAWSATRCVSSTVGLFRIGEAARTGDVVARFKRRMLFRAASTREAFAFIAQSGHRAPEGCTIVVAGSVMPPRKDHPVREGAQVLVLQRLGQSVVASTRHYDTIFPAHTYFLVASDLVY